MAVPPDIELKEAIAAAKAGRADRACEHLHRAQEIEPDNPQIQELQKSLAR